MTNTKQGYTKGPWIREGAFVEAVDNNKETILHIDCEGSSDSPKRDKANAALIAAAPELLGALKGALDALMTKNLHPHNRERAIENATWAIQKAEGRA